MNAKLIEYAYPSSTTATKHGFGKTGCWFIGIYKDANSWEKLEQKGFTNNKQQAINAFDVLANPAHYGMKYFNY